MERASFPARGSTRRSCVGAVRLVLEAREEAFSKRGAISRVADQLDVNRETLRTGSVRPRSTLASATG